MSSETRTFRPYANLAGFQNTLNQIRLNVGGRSLEPDGRVVLSAQEALSTSVDLVFSADDAGFVSFREQLIEASIAAALPGNAVSLVAVVRSRRLREAEVIHLMSDLEDSAAERVLRIGSPDQENRIAAFCAPYGGSDITIYALLNRDLKAEPLRPHHKGTWLAKIRFDLSTELRDIGFSPTPLDDQTRDELGLGKGTMRYLRVDDALLAEPESIEFYVDEELLTRLADQPHTPGARALQRELAIYAMSAIIHRASLQVTTHDSVSAASDLTGTVLGVLLEQLSQNADNKAEQLDALFNLLREDPVRLVALVENYTPDLHRYWAEAIAGG